MRIVSSVGVSAFLIGLLLCSCSRQGGDSAEGPVIQAGHVKIYGTLKGIFHDNRTSAVVQLNSLLTSNRVFGVGALSELRGEITILGGRAFLSYPEGEDRIRTAVEIESTEGAAFLVAAEVASWKPVTTKEIITFGQIDRSIAELAAGAGIDTTQPFPFMVMGSVNDLEWHVVDGTRLPTDGGSRQDHLAASVHRSQTAASTTLVGFFSNNHQGIISHMGTATHIHCVFEDPRATGHVDQVTLPPGITVMFPKFVEEPWPTAK